jgi:hypothetical protein
MLGAMPALAAGQSTVIVHNNSGDALSVWLLTADGTPMYGPVTLNNGDRYARYDVDRATVVRVRSGRCGELQASLTRADWTVAVNRTATGCALATSTKSPR